MNPATNKLELLTVEALLTKGEGRLLRSDGSVVPKHWSIFQMGERVVIKDYTFKVAYIGESVILFEPVGEEVLHEHSDD